MNLLTDQDLYLFNEGSHLRLYDKLGARPAVQGGVKGVYFSVWAPNAGYVSVVGDFNNYDRGATPLATVGQSGIWSGFVPGVGEGQTYKYHVSNRWSGYSVDKADPFAFAAEVAPKTASVVWELDYQWGDQAWMAQRQRRSTLDAPISIYEVHLGSWMRTVHENYRSLSYRELAPKLTEHVVKHGFTHVEFLPLTEHPFFGSWGYQPTGYFAATSRYGTPQDLMYLIDYLHQHDIAVIMDWVPSHFPNDEHGLGYFDGTHLYEHSDPRQGYHPDWNSLIFNYGRHEIRSFLLSSAMFWLDKYHIDGLRVDAVASMLYLDYSRKSGEWVPNYHGGNENLEAISFLRRLNEEIYRHYPDTQTYAEESTAWSGVSRPTYTGGLGFGLKWDMGWMHDSLKYMSREAVHRSYHQGELSFRMVYAFTENFVLPLSHDEVVHGKGSLVSKMPGDDWQKFANLRLLYGYMFAQPGKKLLFMGAEVGQWSEWKHDHSIEWDLLQYPAHAGIARWVGDLNRVYREETALHANDCSGTGFRWVDCSDAASSVFSWLRTGKEPNDVVLAVCNFTPVPRHGYRVGVPKAGRYREILNSDAPWYGGGGVGNLGVAEASWTHWQGQPASFEINIPPLGMLLFKPEDPAPALTSR